MVPHPPPPPLPPPMLLQALSPLSSDTVSDSSSSSDSYNPSLIIIVAILVIASLVTAAIVVVLRLLSRTRPSSYTSSSLPFRSRANSSGFRSSTAAALGEHRGKPTVVVDSLPLVSFTSISASKLSSSSDCAVCLSCFRPGEQLRLLPNCRHAFHTPCIDAWLRSPAASCPLCRSPISTPASPPPTQPPPPSVQSPRASVEPPGDEVAAEAGGSERGWLKEYVDRLASSASSLSSFRISDRWSWRFEASGRSWDPEVADIGSGGGR